MSIVSYMTDSGVKVRVEECRGEPDWANPQLDIKGLLSLDCTCCKGRGTHQVGEGPDRDDYGCDICEAKGTFGLVTGKGQV